MSIRNVGRTSLKVIKWPVYFLQLFTGAKSFSANPVIGSRVLNKLGLHVFRVLLAAAVTRVRYLCLTPFASSAQRKAFLRDGFILIENYLPPAEFNQLKKEVCGLRGEVRQCIQGDTLTQRILLTNKVLANLPACTRLLSNRTLLGLFKFTSAKNTSPIFYVQSVKSNVLDGAVDPQRTLHSDTFHATMKSWLFLDEVSSRNGPFTYVPGSHRITLKRLKWEYKNSVQGASLPNSYAARGSLRIAESDLTELGLGKPVAFEVPANTLVIANTNGFHRRGLATDVSNRMEIWAYSRSNPFNPWPGLGTKWFTRLSHIAIEKYLARQDAIAAAKGKAASWHLVSENALHEMPVKSTSKDTRRLEEVA